MITIQATLNCDCKGCVDSIGVTIRLYKERIMDGTCGDNYPCFMQIIDPPEGWVITELSRFAPSLSSFCPKHKESR